MPARCLCDQTEGIDFTRLDFITSQFGKYDPEQAKNQYKSRNYDSDAPGVSQNYQGHGLFFLNFRFRIT